MDPIHFSNLKDFADCPQTYLWNLEHPKPETETMRIGAYVHKLLLGGHREFQVFPGRRQGKAWDEFEAAYASLCTILSKSEADRAQSIAEAVRRDPVASEALAAGEHEVQLEWNQAGRACAGTVDVLSDDVVTDLKVWTSSNPKWLRWEVLKRAAHAQLAWYSNGAMRSGRPVPKQRKLLIVRNKAPHIVTVLNLKESAMLAGEALWCSWFEQLRQCEASGDWPGYSSIEIDFEAPTETDFVFDDAEEAA